MGGRSLGLASRATLLNDAFAYEAGEKLHSWLAPPQQEYC